MIVRLRYILIYAAWNVMKMSWHFQYHYLSYLIYRIIYAFPNACTWGKVWSVFYQCNHLIMFSIISHWNAARNFMLYWTALWRCLIKFVVISQLSKLRTIDPLHSLVVIFIVWFLKFEVWPLPCWIMLFHFIGNPIVPLFVALYEFFLVIMD